MTSEINLSSDNKKKYFRPHFRSVGYGWSSSWQNV